MALDSLLSGWWDPWRDIPTLAILALGGYFVYLVSSLYDRLRARMPEPSADDGPREAVETWDSDWEDDDGEAIRYRTSGAEPVGTAPEVRR